MQHKVTQIQEEAKAVQRKEDTHHLHLVRVVLLAAGRRPLLPLAPAPCLQAPAPALSAPAPAFATPAPALGAPAPALRLRAGAGSLPGAGLAGRAPGPGRQVQGVVHAGTLQVAPNLAKILGLAIHGQAKGGRGHRPASACTTGHNSAI